MTSKNGVFFCSSVKERGLNKFCLCPGGGNKNILCEHLLSPGFTTSGVGIRIFTSCNEIRGFSATKIIMWDYFELLKVLIFIHFILF